MNLPANLEDYSAEELLELLADLKLEVDEQAYFEKYLKVQPREGGGVMPFVLNGPQKLLSVIFDEIKSQGRLIRVLILKGRRMGVSTYISGRFYRKVSRTKSCYALQITHEPQASEFIFRMVKRFHNLSPKSDRPQTLANNARLLEFNNPDGTGLDSAFRVATAGKDDVGSGQGVHLCHLSEAPKFPHENAESLIKALLPCVPPTPDTEIIFEGTANGVGGEFHARFFGARYRYWVSKLDEGKPVLSLEINEQADSANDYTSIFLPWFVFELNRKELPPGFLTGTSTEDKVAARLLALETFTEEELTIKETYGLDYEQLYWRKFTLANEFKGDPYLFAEAHPACLTGEMRVSTEYGIIKISEAATATMTESGPIKRWGEQPASKIYKITTRLGRVLRGTFDHPVMTKDHGLVGLSSLKVGQTIVLRSLMFAKDTYVEHWSEPFGTHCAITITPEIGRWIGYFMGDGCWHAGTIDFALDSNDMDTVEDVSRLTEKLFGKAPVRRTLVRVMGRKGHVNLRLGCKAAQPMLLRLGLIGTNGSGGYRREICVPECIWRSPKEVVVEFLRGLFETDGSSTAGVVSFATFKQQFAQDVQLLLMGFGINGKIIHGSKTRPNGNINHIYALVLTKHDSRRFHDELGFVGERKRCMRTVHIAIGRPSHARPMEDRIISVEEDGYEVTYDFAMDTEDHLFSAQGILTHNTPEEAFISSGVPYFHNPTVMMVKKNAPPPIARYEYSVPMGQWIVDPKGRLKVWKEPRPGRPYLVSADVAEGLVAGDFFSTDVIDHLTGEQVAQWHGKAPLKEYAQILMGIGKRYNTAYLAPERNNAGVTVVQEIFDAGYPRIHMEMVPEPPNKMRKRYGWVTSSSTRLQILDNLKTEVNEGTHGINCSETCDEMLTFKRQEDGKYEADKGMNDDRVLSLAIGKHLRKVVPVPDPPRPSHIRVQGGSSAPKKRGGWGL